MDLEQVRARLCAQLEQVDDDWVAQIERILQARLNQRRARRIYDITTDGGRVRAARQLAGMAQKELARRISVPRHRLGELERDRHALRHHLWIKKIAGLAMSLGVTVPWLLGASDTGGPRSDRGVLRRAPTPRADRNAEKARRLRLAREKAATLNGTRSQRVTISRPPLTAEPEQ